MTSNNSNIIKAKKVIQNNQEFLLGTFEIRKVRNFTKYTEHLIVGYEEVEPENKIYQESEQIKPIYNPQIQRKANLIKVERIADFLLSDPNAMFPTNLVISIPNQVIDQLEDNNGDVTITLNEVVLKEIDKDDGAVFLTIIDGQHRIRGIERAIERINTEISELSKVQTLSKNKDKIEIQLKDKHILLNRLLGFELVVSFFIDPTLEYQAMIFATINKTQTKVPENLVYSLFGLTKEDSPQKTSLEVVLALNGIEKSPFYNRIKLVGSAYRRGQASPLSQATMVKSILYDISNNARESETDRFKKRSDLKLNPKKLIFRRYYANNEDYMIVRIIYSFFNAVRNTFRDANKNSYWDIKEDKKVTNILQTNVGYLALFKVLISLLPKIIDTNRDNIETYEIYLKKAKINWEDNEAEKRYPFTSSSISTLYQDIIDQIL